MTQVPSLHGIAGMNAGPPSTGTRGARTRIGGFGARRFRRRYSRTMPRQTCHALSRSALLADVGGGAGLRHDDVEALRAARAACHRALHAKTASFDRHRRVDALLVSNA